MSNTCIVNILIDLRDGQTKWQYQTTNKIDDMLLWDKLLAWL
jgi:hypothetical protein